MSRNSDDYHDVITCPTSRLSPEACNPPIRACYLGHVIGNKPIRGQYFLVQSVLASRLPLPNVSCPPLSLRLRPLFSDSRFAVFVAKILARNQILAPLARETSYCFFGLLLTKSMQIQLITRMQRKREGGDKEGVSERNVNN